MCCHVCVDSSPASTPFTSGCRRTGCRSIQRSPKPSSSLPAADRVELRISHRLPSLVCESNRQRSSKVSASHSTAASHSTSTLPTSAKRRTFTSERFVTYVNRCRTTSQKLSPAASSDRESTTAMHCWLACPTPTSPSYSGCRIHWRALYSDFGSSSTSHRR